MRKFKGFTAIALAATMIIGSSFTAFAAGTTEGSTSGEGSSEGHVDKKVLNMVLPTIPDGTTPFAYIMDPERLIQETAGAKYTDYTFPEKASDKGVYFLVGNKTYANTSNTLQAINKSSCAVTLTVKVKATATASDTDITLATSATPATDSAELYLGLKVGETDTVVKADEQTVTKTIAGSADNFETVYDATEGSAGYKYQAKASATTWKAINISMTGAVSEYAITANKTAPTVSVTWSYAEAAENATVDTADQVDYTDGPSLAQTSYTKSASNTPIEVTVNNLKTDTIQAVMSNGSALGAAFVTISGNKVTLTSALLQYVTSESTFTIVTAAGKNLTFTVTPPQS